MAERTHECGACGGPILGQKPKGRPRLYCSDSCRRGVADEVRRVVAEAKRGERAHERAEAKVARQATPCAATCRKCGATFEWKLTRGRRPTCCPACSAAWRPAPCAVCGKTVPGGGSSLPAGQRTCRECRAKSPAPKWQYPPRTCGVCGAEYRAGKKQTTCSMSCGQRARMERDRAAGKFGRPCEVCGTKYSPSYVGQRTCGRECGGVLRLRNLAAQPPKPPRQKPVKVAEIQAINIRDCAECGQPFATAGKTEYCSPSCSSRKHYPLRPAVPFECGWCGETCVIEGQRGRLGSRRTRFCSRRCGKRYANMRRREAEGHRFQMSPVRRRSLYERDEWTCRLCGHHVSRIVPTWAPWAPTLDHIQPQSKGGSDADDNLRTAHLYCNVMRGDKDHVDLPPCPPLFWPSKGDPEWVTMEHCLEYMLVAFRYDFDADGVPVWPESARDYGA